MRAALSHDSDGDAHVVAPATADVALGSTELHAVQVAELDAEENWPAGQMVQKSGSVPA